MEDYLRVGKIVNTKGLQGQLKILATSDFESERFAKGSQLLVFDGEKKIEEVQVAQSQEQKGNWLIKFDGHDHINDVEAYKGLSLYVAKDQLVDLPGDEFYYHQIIGLSVYEGTKKLGVIKEILQPGANDVWVVDRKGKRDLLLPYIKGVVLSVDLEGGAVQVEVPQGLDD